MSRYPSPIDVETELEVDALEALGFFGYVRVTYRFTPGYDYAPDDTDASLVEITAVEVLPKENELLVGFLTAQQRELVNKKLATHIEASECLMEALTLEGIEQQEATRYE